jgi:hypothetical protein
MSPQLRANPFSILNVTTRDTRERILDAAESVGLSGDANAAQEARSVLTNPRKRLEAEMNWLPGLAPSKARTYALQDSVALSDLPELPALPRGNLIADQLASNVFDNAGMLRDLLKALIEVQGDIDLNSVTRSINEDREISKFPAVSDPAVVEVIYAAVRKRWVGSAISALERAPTQMLLDTVHALFDDSGQNSLADELADAYQLHVASFLDRQAEQAQKLCDKMIALGDKPHALDPLIDALAELLITWERVARPIQVNLASRGMAEPKSNQLGRLVRETAVDLFNTHGRLEEAKRINFIIDKLFAAIPELAAQANEDAERLSELDAELAEKVEAERVFNEEIRYSAEIGTIFRKRIDIDAATLVFDGVSVQLGNAQGIRWGATRKSVNGIPTGTDYIVSVRDLEHSIVIQFGNGAIFENLVPRLWRTAGVTLLLSFLGRLMEGESIKVGAATVTDGTVAFSYNKGWGRREEAELNWSDCQVWSENGSFYIAHRDNKKMQVSLPYRDVENVHVLEHMIRGTFKNGSGVLSDCLGG